MAKKSLEQLQYENEKLENDVNRGCAYVALVIFGLIFIGCFVFFTA